MTKISKKIGHDSMSITGSLPSGAYLKFTIGRRGEKLECALSNDIATMKSQMKQIQDWLKYRGNENNTDRFNRLEQVLLKSKNSIELINNLKTV